jgi:1-pyrroline-5-carboxylate dehydrogenase
VTDGRDRGLEEMHMVQPFQNEPLTDFKDPANAEKMKEALGAVRAQLGRTYPLIIGDQQITEGDISESVNPADPDQVVGRFVQATARQAREAVEIADAAFQNWRKRSAEDRANALIRTAAKLRERKFEFAALMVYEVSKSWPEADADIAELIDFLEYYAREALRLAGPQRVVPLEGEENRLVYIPLGVGIVIPPWNFPSAIMGGMAGAAVVAGNTVVIKPASTSPTISAWFVDTLIAEGGLPPGVVNFLPGPGSEIGDVLVDHEKTRFIAFTGSKEVGLRIFERAAKVHPGQKWLKRTVLEMGGKDAIVVDETADLDAAAEGIVASAFGFQGQKCSACSRAIVVDSVYDKVLSKVAERTKQITMGDPTDPSNFMGAVIDRHAFRKIREYIEVGKKEGLLVTGGDAKDGGGYFIPPTIVADVKPDSRLAQEEVFGPLLAFIRARDFDHAMEIANNTEYGLTGALFSKDEDRLNFAADDFHVGNLYLNRKCTGAMVGAQPFGGFNMSGTDSKAGGPDYLLLFTQGKSVTRKR